MRLAAFTNEGRSGVGVVVGEDIVGLGGVAPDLVALLEAGEPALEQARAAAMSGRARIPLADVILGPPVRPRKFFAIGLNYADHIAETGRERPDFPTVFTKAVSCVNGPYDPIVKPRVSDKLDYEGELAFVVGRRCRDVSRDEAPGAIAGYVVANDVSVRDWQARTSQWTLGKSWDSHGPIGPWLVTADELGDPHALGIRTLVNGELRQESNTSQLIFDCFTLLETLSTVCTLEPGDVVATGTPSGVGTAMKPPQYLVPGDVVRVEIDGIGAIENPVVEV